MPETPDDAVTSGDIPDGREPLITELVRLRQALGLTQAQVADGMRTQPGAVSLMESGRSDPRLSTVRRYAAAIGAHLSVSLGRR